MKNPEEEAYTVKNTIDNELQESLKSSQKIKRHLHM